MRILITRPREDATLLAEKLTARGHDVVVEPMLEIRYAVDAKVDLAGVQAVLFTSANGVRAFAAAEMRRDLPAFTVGDTTAAAARTAGFARVESAGGDIGDLARLVREQMKPADGVLLHAAGSAVAGDLAGALKQDGFVVRRIVLYTAEPATALTPVTAAALKARQVDVAVFYSARTAETFAGLVRAAGLAPALSKTVALGLSPAVLEPLKDLPWAMTEAARHPEEADMLRAIVRQKIITQLEGAGAQPPDPQDEIKFGRRESDPPSKVERRKGGRITAVLATLAVLLSLGTFGLTTMQASRPIPEFSSASILRLETRLAALERQMATLARQAPRADVAPAPEFEARLARLAEQIAALEARPAPSPPASAPASDPALPEQLVGLAARLDQLEKALAARPDAGHLAAMLADNRRLAGELARVQEEIAAGAGPAERGLGSAGLLLAINQLRAAAARGAPFAAELSVLRGLAGDDPRLLPPIERLRPLAERPVQAADILFARFSPLAVQAARALRSDAPAADGEWWTALWQRLATVATIRRVGDVPGNDPEALLARAEQRIAARDLPGAVAALDGLSGSAAASVAGWRDEARQRVMLDRVLDELTTLVIAAAPR